MELCRQIIFLNIFPLRMYPCFTTVDKGTPLCLCRSEETSKHFLLHCPMYENQRLKMLNSFRIILTDTPVLTITTDLLLSGSEHLSVDKTHDFLTLFLSSSVNPNALVINHSYCQVHCLPICAFFPYYITFFPNFKT